MTKTEHWNDTSEGVALYKQELYSPEVRASIEVAKAAAAAHTNGARERRAPRPLATIAWEDLPEHEIQDPIDRAVHNSPPPMDDVGGVTMEDFDEKDPYRKQLEQQAAQRKQHPLARGVLDYFPDALMEVAYCSWVATQQHHPNSEMHWDKEKSTDEADCVLRHLKDRGKLDTDGVRHTTKVAWRALALLQRELEMG